MVKAKKFILAKHFDGLPKESDLKLVEEELPPLKDGEILCEAEWLSVDPYMRILLEPVLGLRFPGSQTQYVSYITGLSDIIMQEFLLPNLGKPYSRRFPTGITMIGSQVAKVIESRHKDYPVGVHVVGHFGWCTRCIANIDNPNDKLWMEKPHILPDFQGLPLSLALGALGMPGNTSYFGLLEICNPKPAEVVVVSGAAGAVGSLVGQIAHIKGCTVIGFAGSDEKVRWLKEELGFDHAFNYKTTDVTEALKKAAPNGVDCYFDNVGGTLSSAVLAQMNEFGRISVCGAISAYNADISNLPLAPVIQGSMVFKQLKMEGFVVARWAKRWNEGINQNLAWIKEGKLKYRETITEGFENMPKAFIGMLQGENIGKAVVKV